MILRPQCRHKSLQRSFLQGLTIARLVLVPPIIVTFMVAPLVTAICMAAFMAVDLGDGALARRWCGEDVTRRALDSLVDRVAIDTCLVGAAAVGAMPVILVGALLMRDLYCGAICAHMVHTRRVAIKADVVYRALNASVAAWALTAPFITPTARDVLAGLVLLFAMIVARDLSSLVNAVLAGPRSEAGRVVDAGELRSARRTGTVSSLRPADRIADLVSERASA